MNKMDFCSRFSCPDYPWQATFTKIAAQFKYKMLALGNSSVSLDSSNQKEFTPGATFMLSVILLFILFAAIGTAVTVIEHVAKSRRRNNASHLCENGKLTKNFDHTNRGNENMENTISQKGKNFKGYLSCFCIATNARKILSTESTEGDFGCLHGLRFICNISIITLHAFQFSMTAFIDLQKSKPRTKRWTTPILFNLSYSVDAFFVLSGFLNGYFFFQEYTQKGGKISWLNFYRKRFLRITPMHMFVFWTYATLFTYTGSGPLWPTYDTNPVCRKYWWWNLLYINNFLSCWQQCFVVDWYLAMDMQLYIMSPLLMLALIRWRRLGYTLIAVLISVSSCYNFSITMRYDVTDNLLSSPLYIDDGDVNTYRYSLYFDAIYSKPHTRMVPYFVGITLGHYLWKRGIGKDKRSNKMILCCGWIITVFCMWICFFVFYSSENTLLRRSLYNGVSNILFSAGIAWIVFVCVTQQGGVVNRLLSFKWFIPLSRLSYCAYLINLTVLMHYFLSKKELQTSWSAFAMKYTIFCGIFWTYVISFLTSWFIEVPVSRLIRCYSRKND